MGLSSATELIVNFLTSRQLLPGSWANAVTNALCSIQTATASTTQTQAGGTAITSASAAITTGNANDAVRLPKGYAGLEVWIVNSGAEAAQVFGYGDDTINSVATATGVSQNAATVTIYKVNSVSSAGVANWVSK